MKLRKHRRALVTLVVAIAASLGAYGAYWVFDNDLNAATARDFEANQKLFADTAAHHIERYFYDVEKRMQTIALMPVAQEAVRGEACNQKLQDILAVNSKELSNLGRIDKHGTFVCAVNRTIVGEPASKYGTYFDAIAKDPEHKPAMSRLIAPSGSGVPVIAVHVPVYDNNGQFSGTIGGAVYLEELQNRITSTLPSKDAILALYDDNLDILYHPDPLIRGKNLSSEEILKLYTPRETMLRMADELKKPNTQGTAHYNFRGEPRQAVYRSIPVVGRSWSLHVAVPNSNIREAVNRNTARWVVIATLVMLVIAVTLLVALAQLRNSKKVPSKV